MRLRGSVWSDEAAGRFAQTFGIDAANRHRPIGSKARRPQGRRQMSGHSSIERSAGTSHARAAARDTTAACRQPSASAQIGGTQLHRLGRNGRVRSGLGIILMHMHGMRMAVMGLCRTRDELNGDQSDRQSKYPQAEPERHHNPFITTPTRARDSPDSVAKCVHEMVRK